MPNYIISDLSKESPDMPDEEFRELIEDIRRHGQLVPIWKSGNEIIDGRKRLKACEILGIEPNVIDTADGLDILNPDKAFSSEELAYSLNVIRTHYTTSQRAMFAARSANLTYGHKKTEQKSTHKKGDQLIPLKTVADTEKEFSVSRPSIKRAKAVLREGSPEIIEAVDHGKLTVSRAREIVKLPKKQQAGALEKAINGKGIRIAPHAERFNTCVSDIRVQVNTMQESVGEAKKDDRRKEWLKVLRSARTQLSRIIKRLEGK